jgi:uncharacterized protein (DUF934 family)
MLETHKQIIKDRAVVDDDWSVLRLEEGQEAGNVEVPAGKIIVPLAVWLAQRATLAGRAQLGVWFAADDRADALGDDLARFTLIGVDFAKFTDGRGYSIAYNLRKRLGYKGELRALGDVLRDQLFAMQRVGFDAFATRQDRSIHDALLSLTTFSDPYQASVDEELPLWRRRLRGQQAEHSDLGAGI